MEISLTSIKKSIVHVLHRFHVLIFVIFVLGGLAGVVLLLNSTIQRSGDSSNYTSAAESTSFDEATIERLKNLKTREESPTPLNLPAGRNSPFIE